MGVNVVKAFRLLCIGLVLSACVGEADTATTRGSLTPSSPSTVAPSSTITDSTMPSSNMTEPECDSGDRNPEEPAIFEPTDPAVPDGVDVVTLDAPVLDVAVDEGTVWAVTEATAGAPYRLLGIDIHSLEVTHEVQLQDASKVAARGDVWITQMWRDTLIRVSPHTLSNPTVIDVPQLPPGAALGGDDNCFGPSSITVTDSGAWFDGRGVVGFANAETETVTTILPPSGEISKGGNVAVGFGSVWVDSGGWSVWRIDESALEWVGGIDVSQHSGHSAASLAVGPEALWVSGGALERDVDGSVTHQLADEGGGISTVDASSGTVIGTIELDDFPLLASDGGTLMVAWENGTGLWAFEEASLGNQRLVACTEVTVGSLATTENAAWLGHYDSGQIWRVPIEGQPSCTS